MVSYEHYLRVISSTFDWVRLCACLLVHVCFSARSRPYSTSRTLANACTRRHTVAASMHTGTQSTARPRSRPRLRTATVSRRSTASRTPSSGVALTHATNTCRHVLLAAHSVDTFTRAMSHTISRIIRKNVCDRRPLEKKTPFEIAGGVVVENKRFGRQVGPLTKPQRPMKSHLMAVSGRLRVVAVSGRLKVVAVSGRLK